ncbi:TetR/AcrR family transcriptional regulator [Pseudonocardia sp. TRM90224]|uniref:TetR/AcrR family transcriptional regulator n=1 Tax=Pseudonocardia sp. TRM90224 TaxID=2812678 RepID=UPI001E4C333F|nr:TetR/AcrR family transcriptional regulator [Pseudonocardia sp. TRM90224]
MVDAVGRQQRKKQLTRLALVDAAVRLFTERGYERTTVADIAEAADVSARTFFLHFPTKEDVLLADTAGRLDRGVDVIAGRDPASTPAEVLAETIDVMITDAWAGDLHTGLAALRARLVIDTPAVQAHLLQNGFAAQTRIATALHEAYRDRIDEVTAAAIVGALMGAVAAAAVTALRRGDPPDGVRAAMRRAAAIAMRAVDNDL